MKGLLPCGCGQCLPCRINKRRMWANRILLERQAHNNAAFVTLTYRDEELKDFSGEAWSATRPVLGTLVPGDLQAWLKRLRKRWASPLRFFAVGEYGDQSGRPHYHVALFGFPCCLNGRSIRTRSVSESGCCSVCRLVSETWALGRIDVGELNKDTAQYIAGYVTKKWTKEDLWTKEKLKGRRPEFSRMSLRPGIGATAIKSLVSSTVRTRQGKYVTECLDAPVVLRNGGSMLPLGKYLRKVWREALGRGPDAPESAVQGYVSELYRVYKEDVARARADGVPAAFCDAASAYFQKNIQKIRSLEAKAKIFQSRRSI